MTQVTALKKLMKLNSRQIKYWRMKLKKTKRTKEKQIKIIWAKTNIKIKSNQIIRDGIEKQILKKLIIKRIMIKFDISTI